MYSPVECSFVLFGYNFKLLHKLVITTLAQVLLGNFYTVLAKRMVVKYLSRSTYLVTNKQFQNVSNCRPRLNKTRSMFTCYHIRTMASALKMSTFSSRLFRRSIALVDVQVGFTLGAWRTYIYSSV